MREFKFRAWFKRYKLMCPWEEFKDTLDFYSITTSKKYDVMQFTGLHDRNGKEIYEGDIYRFYSSTYEEIVTCPIEWMFDPTMLDCNGEVIGNIYENPELINGDKTKGGQVV